MLPSIVSSRLSYVHLQVEGHPLDEEWDEEIDYPAWAAVEVHLCRLAKRFGSKNPGKKMGVCIYGDYESGAREDHFLDCVECETFLPRLKEEAEVFVSNEPPDEDEDEGEGEDEDMDGDE